MLYGTEFWMVKNQHKKQVSVAKMAILSWMNGKSRRNMIRITQLETELE